MIKMIRLVVVDYKTDYIPSELHDDPEKAKKMLCRASQASAFLL